jgi:hypothetical protein
MTPKNKRTRPKTLREVIRNGLAKDCGGLCMDDSGDLDLAAEAIESLVRDYFDDPGPT